MFPSIPLRDERLNLLAQMENHLEVAVGGTLPIKYRLQLRSLATTLVYDDFTKREVKAHNKDSFKETAAELTQFLETIIKRKGYSDFKTAELLGNLPEAARSILFSQIAIKFRKSIDDWSQINFSLPEHVELLKSAVTASIGQVSKKRGRPADVNIIDFFIALKNIYEECTGEVGLAQNRFNKLPQTQFETLVYCGYRLLHFHSNYDAAIKAFHSALQRDK
ncbi:MAG: hypothetical protein O2910_00020 [Proteobacteria bacterium]|nr:hypothetical protein [Pseudomonadota bacterium]